MKLFRRAKRKAQVKFCDGCARVCDERCRADTVRERAQTSALQAPAFDLVATLAPIDGGVLTREQRRKCAYFSLDPEAIAREAKPIVSRCSSPARMLEIARSPV